MRGCSLVRTTRALHASTSGIGSATLRSHPITAITKLDVSGSNQVPVRPKGLCHGGLPAHRDSCAVKFLTPRPKPLTHDSGTRRGLRLTSLRVPGQLHVPETSDQLTGMRTCDRHFTLPINDAR